jgi:hypothetical protein
MVIAQKKVLSLKSFERLGHNTGSQRTHSLRSVQEAAPPLPLSLRYAPGCFAKPNRWAAKSVIGVSELVSIHNMVLVLTRNIKWKKQNKRTKEYAISEKFI